MYTGESAKGVLLSSMSISNKDHFVAKGILKISYWLTPQKDVLKGYGLKVQEGKRSQAPALSKSLIKLIVKITSYVHYFSDEVKEP